MIIDVVFDDAPGRPRTSTRRHDRRPDDRLGLPPAACHVL